MKVEMGIVKKPYYKTRALEPHMIASRFPASEAWARRMELASKGAIRRVGDIPKPEKKAPPVGEQAQPAKRGRGRPRKAEE